MSSLRTAQEIYNQICWDDRFDAATFVIGFDTRFDGLRETPLDEFSSGGAVPWHRVQYIRNSDGIQWDRRSKFDAIAGTGDAAAKPLEPAPHTHLRTDTMKAKDLLNIGIPEGKLIGLTMGILKSHPSRFEPSAIEFELRELLAHPARYEGHFKDLALELSKPKPITRRATPAPYRVWGEGLEAGALQQMRNAAELPVAVAGALMPDAHQGYGLPIGGVLATKDSVIPYAVGVDIACFTGDTRITLLDGQTEQLSTLAARDTAFAVYACTPSGKVIAALARALKTSDSAPLVSVTLDNQQTIRCTPDHEFMLRDGTFARADQLEAGTSLMPLYTDIDRDGYTRVQQNYSGRMQKAHWVVARSGLLGVIPKITGQRTIIHHRDFDGQNNVPDNLEFMGNRDHSSFHRLIVERNRSWQSPEFEVRRIASLKAKAGTPDGHAYFAERGSRNLKRYWQEHPQEARDNCAGNGERGKEYLIAKNQSEAGRAKSRELAARVHTCAICGEEVRSYIGLHNHRRWRHGVNHKVMSVQSLPEREAVYCLSVPGIENFALAAGVFVHNCRMKLSVFDLPAGATLKRRFEDLKHALETQTRFGMGSAWERPQQHAVLDADWSVTRVTKNLFAKARTQLGTSGSGNHFVEFGLLTLSKPDLGLEAGEYLALLSHSGSRGSGAAVAKHYSDLAMKLHPELPKELKHLSWLEMGSSEGQEYWAAMNLMGGYASGNHAVIHRNIAKALGAEVLATIENHHNFAWLESHVIDGAAQEVYVHRKGATPAGRGVLGVIPGSMATPGYVVRGLGNEASLLSASHGAGRAMSRTAAKEKFNWKMIRPQLEAAGVTLLSAGIDENPLSYKDIASVMAAQTDLVDVVARFDPRIVKMADDGTAED